MTVLRTYNELNREMFEKISANNQQEESKKTQREKSIISKWDALEQKYGN